MMPRNGNGEYSAEEKYILYKRGIINTDSVNPTYQTLTEDQKLLASIVDNSYLKLFQ